MQGPGQPIHRDYRKGGILMHAARNSALCTKDCLCLFICPTGATDTENGQIDFNRCLDGCRLCVDACPSHAIYLVMDSYFEKPVKQEVLKRGMLELARRKAGQESMAAQLQQQGSTAAERLLGSALRNSLRILVEDCLREAGYMLPQGRDTIQFITDLAADTDEETRKQLLGIRDELMALQ